MVEALTYRLSDHTTADDASRYRPRAQLDEAWEKEPLLRIRKYLNRAGAWDDAQEKELQGRLRAADRGGRRSVSERAQADH